MTPTVKGVVTIDVEPDNVWVNNKSQSLENIKLLPTFHILCQKYGIRPTYLVTWSVASNPACISILESILSHGDCEIGIHPHLWEIPPFVPKDAESIAWVGPDYTLDILEAKLTNLITLIKSKFGTPASHRAGRWGMDIRQVGILLQKGIKIDTSVTPGIDWSTTGASNYTRAPFRPYQLGDENLTLPGNSILLEVPCTIMPGWRAMGLEKMPYLQSIWKHFNLDYQWLRVLPNSSATNLERVCAWAYTNLPHLNLMSHSSEFMAGGSPYWRTKEEVERHFGMYREIFSWWQEHGIKPQTLSEFSVCYQSSRSKG